jgi:hypothetical protein
MTTHPGRLRLLIGIDDTDNETSRGTGFRARGLGQRLASEGLAQTLGITRHQLLVDPRIPYTSHNSSLCLAVDVDSNAAGEIIDFAREFLIRESAPGSDAGLCVARAEAAQALAGFGARAKREVLTMQDALALAQSHDIFLEGLTGTRGGVIGALAGVGLRASQRDGRFVWLPGVREMSGVLTADTILQTTGIDEIRSIAGGHVSGAERIETSPWPRPVLLEGRAVLLVQPTERNDGPHEWRLAPKDLIKQY